MRINLLLLFAITIGFASYSRISAQTSTYEGPLRGEMAATPTNNIELEATLETVKLDNFITEIEDAGYSMDVNEGFDEEWEEEIWIASDADDMEALLLPSDELGLMEADEVVSQDELLEEWEDPTWIDTETSLEEIGIVEESISLTDDEEGWEADLLAEEVGDDESEFAYLTDSASGWQEDGEWWETDDDEYDASWDDLQEEWEFDALEDAYESEDMEYMEMMYGVD